MVLVGAQFEERSQSPHRHCSGYRRSLRPSKDVASMCTDMRQPMRISRCISMYTHSQSVSGNASSGET